MKIRVGTLRRIIKEEARRLRLREGMGAGFPRSEEELADRLRPAFRQAGAVMPDFTKIGRLWSAMQDTEHDGGGWSDFVSSDVLDWLQVHTDLEPGDMDAVMGALSA